MKTLTWSVLVIKRLQTPWYVRPRAQDPHAHVRSIIDYNTSVCWQKQLRQTEAKTRAAAAVGHIGRNFAGSSCKLTFSYLCCYSLFTSGAKASSGQEKGARAGCRGRHHDAATSRSKYMH